MTDRKALGDQDETPEDVATLYSWANLHGAKYRDFSASRAQTREKARQRVQEAIDMERQRPSSPDPEPQRTIEPPRAVESSRVAEAERRAEQAAQDNARRAEQLAAQQRAWQAERSEHISPENHRANLAPTATEVYRQPQPQQQPESAQPRAYEQAHEHPIASAQTKVSPQFQPPQQKTPPSAPPSYVPMQEESYQHARGGWNQAEPPDGPVRPAWLSADRTELAQQPVPPAPDDTLQASRDRLTSRWFALKGVFAGAPAAVEPAPPPVSSRAPILAVFSLAGGVGKTSLVATLGRALSARGERVLLVDTASYGLLPFFFGARDRRPGVLRTFTPPGGSGDSPVQMVTIDPEALGSESAIQEPLSQEILLHGRNAGRVIIDLATASGATTRRVLRMAPTVLVPMIPDMSSVVSVGSIDSFFQNNTSSAGHKVTPYYVLSQFDPSLPLHLDVREVLREQLGERLLPFVLRRTPAVSEALAEGMTVMDYAPNSTAAEDFGSLAGWIKNLAAPATLGYRGVRWSER